MESVIVHYQEVALKGRNRPWFVERLVSNLRTSTADLGVVRVRPLMGRIEVVPGPDTPWSALAARIAMTFGVANFSPARRAGRSVEEISAAILEELPADDVASFRVKARRADKSYPLTSPEIERQVGGRIKAARGWPVDLKHPQLVVSVEVLPRDVFYLLDKQTGPGGLPSGVSGHVLCLLSGGIDSPVAAYRLMKRGCRVRLVHFHSYPLLSHASQDKVREIARWLTHYQLTTRLYLVAFGEIQRRIVLGAPPPLRIVLYRRLMMRIAERLARRSKSAALVTGEAVGQVASQTLENLAAINAAVSLPVLRPLIGSDKEEITAEAQAIGTYPISIIPDQDCCQLFTPRNPATKARLDQVQAVEAELPIDEMVQEAVRTAEREDYAFPESSVSPGAAARPPRAGRGPEDARRGELPPVAG